jgi:hypothetical protein
MALSAISVAALKKKKN